MLDPFPEAKRGAIAQGLMAAFGADTLDGPPQPVTGGMSGAGVWRIRVGGIAYLLRLDLAPDAFRDPLRGHACLRTFQFLRAILSLITSGCLPWYSVIESNSE